MDSILALADLATPMAVRVAATLGVVERAGGAGATVEQLATGTVAPARRCLLDHLVTVGVFEHDEGSGRYRPTDLGAQMHEDAPAGASSPSSTCSRRSPPPAARLLVVDRGRRAAPRDPRGPHRSAPGGAMRYASRRSPPYMIAVGRTVGPSAGR